MNIKLTRVSNVFSGVYTMRKLMHILSVMLLAVTLPAWATVSMTDVQFNALPGDKVELKFQFDGTPPEPKIYTIDKPARIALDLANTHSQLKQRQHVLDIGNMRGVMVVQAKDTTRVVVNLVERAQYETRVEGNTLFVTVGNVASKDYYSDASDSGIEKDIKVKASAAIDSIDFRRGDNSEGRLIVELSNPNINIDSKMEGRRIKLTFANTNLPENLQLNYDVSDFATPVQSFKASEEKGAATIELLPTGDYDYLAYQTDKTYVLTIKPMTREEIEAKKKEFAFVGDKLSLNFQDIEVRSVLQLIADFTDLNLVASDTVSGRITLRLQNVPWDQALDLILKTKGLDKRVDGNVLMVAPAAEIAQREQQQIQSNKQIQDLAPLQTEFIRARYALASDIFSLLQGKSGGEGGAEASSSLLSSRATVVVDQRTNSLLVTETAAKIEEIRKLINLIDVPVRQVVIEARIISANASDAEKLGVAWGAGGATERGNNDQFFAGGSQVGGALSHAGTGGTGGNFGVGTTHGNIVDLGVTDLGTSNFNLGFISANGRQLIDLQLSAIESSGHGEVVTQPKIITGDKQEASIKSGTQIPYQETSPNGASTTAFKDAVLELKVTPNITPDDRIIMELNIKQDSVGDTAVNGTPVIATNEIQTNVLVANGETVVLGGVFQTSEREAVVKTPFFGDLPLIGRLFRRTEMTKQKSELLIFITPRILSEVLTQ